MKYSYFCDQFCIVCETDESCNHLSAILISGKSFEKNAGTRGTAGTLGTRGTGGTVGTFDGSQSATRQMDKMKDF